MRLALTVVAVSVTACGGDAPASTSGDRPQMVTNSVEGVWAQAGQQPWTLEQSTRVGVLEGDETEMFGSIRAVLPGPDDGIWVLDTQALELRLFDSAGDHVRSVGGLGDGPGEFGRNTCAFLGPQDEVWVESRGLWHRFSAAGDFLDATRVTRATSGCDELAWTTEGSLIARIRAFEPSTSVYTTSYLVHDLAADGSVVRTDTVASPVSASAPRLIWKDEEGRSVIMADLPLTQPAFERLGPSGALWISEGLGDYRVRRQSVGGDTLLEFGREYEPVPVPDSLRSRLIAELEHSIFGMPADFDVTSVPRAFPAFEDLRITPSGSAWVVRRSLGGGYSFDVFNESGAYLGAVAAPPAFEQMYVYWMDDDFLVASVTDDLGVARAVRFDVRRP
jgi:hypothetical protein